MLGAIRSLSMEGAIVTLGPACSDAGLIPRRRLALMWLGLAALASVPALSVEPATASAGDRVTASRVEAKPVARRAGTCRARRERSRRTSCRAARGLRVVITSGPPAESTSERSRVSFALSSHAADARFECSIDDARFSACSSPAGFDDLSNGTHSLRVFAVRRGVAGRVATWRWSVDVAPTAGKTLPASSSSPPAPTSPSPSPPAGNVGGNEPAPLTAWVPAHNGIYTPLSDQAAAADVTPAAENRPANAAANDYMPTSAQLQAFYGATNSFGQTVVTANPYYAYVTGHFSGTTDEIIQWAAWKWGIPADWLRAQYSVESYWRQSQMGDVASVSPAVYAEYPPQARIPGGDQVNETMGISAIKWIPDGSVGAGTDPLRWESTAFACDYEAATIRYYYDDPDGLRTAWGDSSYFAGNAWDALGGWFEPYPWLNSGQLDYIAKVQAALADRTWAQPGF